MSFEFLSNILSLPYYIVVWFFSSFQRLYILPITQSPHTIFVPSIETFWLPLWLPPCLPVSILIFRRGYDSLCGDRIIGMLHQILTNARICCTTPLLIYSATHSQHTHMRYVQSSYKGNQNRVASRCQCDGFVLERGRYLMLGDSASDAPPSVHQRWGTHKAFCVEGAQ